MDFISTADAAGKWGVSERQVQRLLAAGRIPGAKKYGVSWMIPADAKKPADPRRVKNLPQEARSRYAYVYFGASSMPKKDADAVMRMMEEKYRPLAKSLFAYLRGDFKAAKKCYQATDEYDENKLTMTVVAMAVAISSEDRALYREAQSFLENCMKEARSEEEKIVASLPQAMVIESARAPEMTPDWLKNGDFSGFPPSLRSFLLYLHLLYLRDSGRHAEVLAAGKTALTFCADSKTFTHLDIYFNLLCATSSYILKKTETAQAYIVKALDLGMPHGFIIPFVEYVPGLGGLMEELVRQHYPAQYERVFGQAEPVFRNWMSFHNEFTREHITTILSTREYHAAVLLTNGATYAEAAGQMNISRGRFKNIISEVYAKLDVSGRKELTEYIR